MNLLTVKIQKPEDLNFILGQSHFIKTVEDIHEALVSTVPGIKFGLAFTESFRTLPGALERHGRSHDPARPAERHGDRRRAFFHPVPGSRLLPDQCAQCHKNGPRGVPHFLRNGQPGGGDCGQNQSRVAASWG